MRKRWKQSWVTQPWGSSDRLGQGASKQRPSSSLRSIAPPAASWYGGSSTRRRVVLRTLVVALLPCPARAHSHSHTLKTKTCNETYAGTKDPVLVSFCTGSSNCIAGPTNAYLDWPLATIGSYNEVNFLLETEPTTMILAASGTDAWCIEEVVWDDGPNLLGRGGRIYLDNDRGDAGCTFGVHSSLSMPSLYFPCTNSWRFFNLQGSETYNYEIEVQSCQTISGPTRVLASICSESTCNDDVGDIVHFDLAMTNMKKGERVTTNISASFNPVAMKLTSSGDNWCASQILFNKHRLVNTTITPRVQLVGDGEDRYFYNLQILGTGPGPRSSSDGGEGSAIESTMWEMLVEVIIAVSAGLVFTTTVAGASFLYKKVWSRYPHQSENDDVLEPPLCEVCRVRKAVPLWDTGPKRGRWRRNLSSDGGLELTGRTELDAAEGSFRQGLNGSGWQNTTQRGRRGILDDDSGRRQSLTLAVENSAEDDDGVVRRRGRTTTKDNLRQWIEPQDESTGNLVLPPTSPVRESRQGGIQRQGSRNAQYFIDDDIVPSSPNFDLIRMSSSRGIWRA